MHLFLGTAKDNMQDMISKGRKVVGERLKCSSEKHPGSKLTDDQVRFIRSNKISSTILSKKFSVSVSTITAARRKSFYRDVK
jgi:hypothetical protein